MSILQDFNQKHQSNNCSSAPENLNDQPTTAISSNSTQKTANRLNHQDFEHCCQERDLNADWILANCSSVTIKEASELLGYPAKSPGILIQGANGQYQFRPNKPWSSKQGKKAPKYRTAAGDEYDALLPQHPTDKFYWNNIEKLKQQCYQIDGHPMLLVTEGGFKAISTCSHNLPTLALLGVEMGLTASKDDPQGKRYLVPELERFAKLGFGFILAFDCDTYSKKPVLQALIKLASQLLKFEVPVYTLPKWDESEGKGIDDYIQKNSIEEFRNKLLSQAISFEDWYQEYGKEAFDRKPPKPDIIGAQLAEKYRDYWVYCDQLKSWLAYGLETEGIWTMVSKEYLAAEVHAILKARNIVGYGTNAYIENIIGTLKRELFLRKWSEKSSTDWLPFRNGVLELATNKLHPHSPGFKFTWQLPRDYTVVETGWSAIDAWLNEATQGNAQYKQLLVCFAAAVLRGRNDLQKFLHLIGGGGSGKSTFTTLLTAIIGAENTATLNLPDLEDKHEIARIFGKRLVVLPDQDKAPKKMSNFKRLTGQDRLSGRRLFENGFEFVFQGLVVVTSNFPLFHTNLGSWLTRRVNMIPFDYQCPKEQKRNLMAEFNSELGAFTSYLLNIPIAEIENTLKGIGQQSLSGTVWESQIRSDGMAAWVNEWLIEDSSAKVPIGSNSKEWLGDREYDPESSSLYGSYALYCQQSNRSTKSLQNFSAELLELVNRTLGWQAAKARVKIAGQTVRVIKGVRLRSYLDDNPTIEEILEGDSPGSSPGSSPGDNPKPLPNQAGDRGDNLFLTNEKNNNNFSTPCANSPTGTVPPEVEKNNSLNKFSSAVASVTIQSQQEFEPVTAAVTSAGTAAVTESITSADTSAITEVDTESINWLSYPYKNSSDSYTLKNRANKVKERILNCATNNELIKLHATGEVSEPEITWIKANLLTQSELQQLELIEATTQNSLFDNENCQEQSESSAIEVGDLVTVQTNQLEALVIDLDSQSGLYEITYLESEKTVWEGLANLTKL